jgi:hypothetical protein
VIYYELQIYLFDVQLLVAYFAIAPSQLFSEKENKQAQGRNQKSI